MLIGSIGQSAAALAPIRSVGRRTAGFARWTMAIALVLLLATAGTGVVLAEAPAEPLNPARLVIPAIGVQAAVQTVGLADDGSMGIPDNFTDVAWYSLGAAPGQAGNAVFTGHISSTAAAAVFYNIDQLAPGNMVRVTGDDGRELVFVVQEVDTYKAENVPMARIFAPSDQAGVVLITCGGTWDPNARLFSDRVVVFASLATGS